MTEDKLQGKLAVFLQQYFEVEREVKSVDKTKRIDLVIIHKSDIVQKYPIGIEIKLSEKKKGKDLALWIKQASTYSEKTFGNYGKMLIVAYPQISGLYLNEGTEMNKHDPETKFVHANNISTFLGEFKIGEFQRYYENNKKYYQIAYKGQIIWDQKYDRLHTNNYERLCIR